MEDKNFLSKIIKEICNENLIPLGVFQKGNSRLYLDDNGYFFTIIEFQPSSWTIGTYLNIGLTFLWNQSDALCFAFSRQPAARYGKFVEYKNEAQFRTELKKLIKVATEEILFYRKLRELKFAMKWMCSYASNYDGGEYQKFSLSLANICLLNGDIKSAKFYYDKYLSSADSKGQTVLHNLSIESLLSNIKATREMWHCKSSMKKMPFSQVYDN